MRGGHCLKVWTKKQQVLSLSTAERGTVRSSQNRVRRIGDPERGEGPVDSMWIEPTPGFFGNDVPGQPQRPGRNTSTCSSSHGKCCRNVNPADLDDETTAETEH